MRILAVSGSLRADSHNTSLLRAAIEAAPEGVEIELWEGVGDLPIYDQDLEHDPPESVLRLREDWAAADAILFATPEYNGSVPGGLKNAIDWASRPKLEAALTNQNAAVVGASTGLFGAIWAQDHLRKALSFAGASVLEDELPIGQAHETLAESGRIIDPELRQKLDDIIGQLITEAEQKVTV